MKSEVKKYELCILIPCYNNIDGLKKSLKSIVYDIGNYLIVVVDDGSREEITKECIAHPTFGCTHIVHHTSYIVH